MKLESPLQFLEDKTILVTGAAGFLAKIFVEKVLRVQPGVKKLFLLIRAEDDKYDVALNVNTLGARHVVEFAKKCTSLAVMVHVSTAYVSGEREGVIPERPYHMGETLNGVSGLDIDAERRVVEERLEELRAEGASDEAISVAMKELGIERFDDSNTEKLRVAAMEGGVEGDVFYFDPKCIDWGHYVTNIHIPGIVKYVFKRS
ncbi:hypothetical protein SAY86_026030 [Trapa natans]|uniref:Fatty acyl-CoA reductase n=1 Tax=Trapa natans TaxID=22666 RepID=A0AAN7KD03_TRANT|nr:hypothetical protein SAY86_026030 [Trapa natans]